MLGFFVGLLLGLSLAAPPGPMNALITREAGRSGFAAALRVGLAAPLADVVFLVVVLTAGTLWYDPAWTKPLAGLGALIMLRLAATASRPGAGAPTIGAAFFMALTNPFQIAWWLSAGLVLLHGEGSLAVAGFLVGIFAWVVVLAAAVATMGKRFPAVMPYVEVWSTDLLAAFAALLALRVVA